MNYPTPEKYSHPSAPRYLAVPQYAGEFERTPFTPDERNFAAIWMKARQEMMQGVDFTFTSKFTAEDEIKADLNAMKIFLAMGHSHSDTLKTFAKVLQKSSDLPAVTSFRKISDHLVGGRAMDINFSQHIQQRRIDGYTHVSFEYAKAQDMKFTFFPSVKKQTLSFWQRIKKLFLK